MQTDDIAKSIKITTSMAQTRRTMVDCQLRTFDITDLAVLDAFEAIPREAFVGDMHGPVAYSDAMLRVRAGAAERVLLTPMVLGRLLQGAAVRRGDRALDVGGGFGYSAAILAAMGASVVALEDDPGLSSGAAEALARCGAAGVSAATGPLDAGWAQNAPYNVILINGAVETDFAALFDQLAPRGRLVAVTRAPGQSGLATKAMRFERLEGHVRGEKWLFDAAAETLPAFRRKPGFVF